GHHRRRRAVGAGRPAPRPDLVAGAAPVLPVGFGGLGPRPRLTGRTGPPGDRQHGLLTLRPLAGRALRRREEGGPGGPPSVALGRGWRLGQCSATVGRPAAASSLLRIDRS